MTAKLLQFSDRRKRRRFPIELPLQYRTKAHGRVNSHGRGMTVNISSKGLLMIPALPLRSRVTVSLEWPADLDGTPLQLIIQGRVVRMVDSQCALSIIQHEFRTRGRAQVLGNPAALFRAA